MKTILIVEDELTLSNALREYLKKDGYSLITAKDGQEGFDIAMLKHPDLILLDLLMPKVNGLTMLAELRKDPWGKDVEVIILSNIDSNQEVSQAMALGVHTYAAKSDIKLEDLSEEIKRKIA